MYQQYLPLAARAVKDVDNREQVREFLTSRRAKINPEQAGLPTGSRRRLPEHPTAF